MKFRAGYRILVAAFVGAAALAACGSSVDLAAAQQYAAMAQQAQASFDAIAEDYDASCERQRELNLQPEYLTWEPAVPSASSASPAPQPALSPTPRPSATPFFGAGSQETCVVTAGYAQYPLGAVSRDWKHANDTLLVYIQALGAVANLAAAPSPSVSPLTGAAVTAKLMTAPQAAQVEVFARDIITYLQKSERERDVRVFLEQVNTTRLGTGTTDFADAVSALRTVGGSYRILIANECIETSNLYVRALATLSATRGHGEDALVVARAYRMRRAWSTDLAACAAHQSAASGYLKTLDGIAKTNDALVASERAPRTSPEALRADIADLSDTVSSLYAVVFTRATPPAATPKPKSK